MLFVLSQDMECLLLGAVLHARCSIDEALSIYAPADYASISCLDLT